MFASILDAPANLAAVPAGEGWDGAARELIYYVTAANDKGEESAPSDEDLITLGAYWPVGGIVKLTWDSVPGADHYVVYKSQSGQAGYIGTAKTPKFTDDNIVPDSGWGVPNLQNPFSGEDNYPGAVGIYQQRLMFGRTNNNPLTVYGSQSGSFTNFNTRTPLRDDDMVEFQLASTQVNEILYFIPLKDLIIITSAGPWSMSPGSSSDALTPTSVNAAPEGYTPAHRLKPIVIGKSILFMEAFGQIVKDMLYNFTSNSLEGTNLSVLAAHLFAGHSIIDWAYQRSPDSIVWCIRDDGVLLGLTYMREHKVWGWHQHETDGFFESVCSIKGTDYDEVYFIVRREVNGTTKRYIERMKKRIYNEPVEEAYFVDCGLTYRGDPATVISGLEHLEGKAVSVLADGNVIPDMTVTNGTIELDHPASIVHVGLPYNAEFQSLPLDFTAMAGPMHGKKKNVSAISAKVEKTRGGWMGPDSSNLYEMKYRDDENYSEATNLFTGDKAVSIEDDWRTDASVFVRQSDPLPITILSLSLEVNLGDD
jgi:hypothetical protein